MRGRAFTLPSFLSLLVSSLSLLLCAATVLLWVRSYSVADCLYRGTCERGDEIHLARGSLALDLLVISHPKREWRYHQEDPRDVNVSASDEGELPDARFLGFEWSPSVNLFAIPLWFVAATTLVLPTHCFLRKARTGKSGSCTACGYNLTGNVSGICPECGTPQTQHMWANTAEAIKGTFLFFGAMDPENRNVPFIAGRRGRR
ncbi:MAG TPA: hypothetical protein VN541_10980 [Tepidisphaeraceae bacterium]|nr:hypothetical protein [Tepidisphaeraceae bacterium]